MTDKGVSTHDAGRGVGTPDMRPAYDRRWQRVLDCVALCTPDRMPIGLMMNYWLARYGGITHREQMYDYEKVTQIAERMVDEFEPDFFTSPFGSSARTSDAPSRCSATSPRCAADCRRRC